MFIVTVSKVFFLSIQKLFSYALNFSHFLWKFCSFPKLIKYLLLKRLYFMTLCQDFLFRNRKMMFMLSTCFKASFHSWLSGISRWFLIFSSLCLHFCGVNFTYHLFICFWLFFRWMSIIWSSSCSKISLC